MFDPFSCIVVAIFIIGLVWLNGLSPRPTVQPPGIVLPGWHCPNTACRAFKRRRKGIVITLPLLRRRGSMTYRNRPPIAQETPTESASPLPVEVDVPPTTKPVGTHEEIWIVQKIEDVIVAIRVTIAPKNDDTHRVVFDVAKEQAAQYAVGGEHVITIGARVKFWWEGEEEP